MLMFIVMAIGYPTYMFVSSVVDQISQNSTQQVDYCSSLVSAQQNIEAFLKHDIIVDIFLCGVAIIILVGCFGLLKCTSAERIHSYRLSSRYILKQIVKSMRTIALATLLFALFLAINGYGAYLILEREWHSKVDMAFFKELVSLAIPVYIIIYCFVFYFTDIQVMKYMYFSIFGVYRCSTLQVNVFNVIPANADGLVHHTTLINQWERKKF
uniref:G_PROTEIN_RECEP_F1_2 domain-containing protein n=1 Tax=Rhabditophanes sp. KR3021 TaxID=114890 RepID=A0AC35TFU9_9BILA